MIQAEVSGICHKCGCTDSTACIGMNPQKTMVVCCGWANKKRTLCTFCRDKRQKVDARKK